MTPVRDAYEDGECPDCGLAIPPDAVVGDACTNCTFVFNGEAVCDDDDRPVCQWTGLHCDSCTCPDCASPD